jgi:hypothetical protein
MFSAQTIKLIFSNLEELAQLHQKMERKLAKESTTKVREHEFANIFGGLAAEMRIYAQVKPIIEINPGDSV